MPASRVPDSLRQAPFTVAQAAAAGLTAASLRSGAWRRVFRDVYVLAASGDTLEQRVSAARLALPPNAVLRGTTAAWLHGIDVRRPGDLTVHAFVAPEHRVRQRPGLAVSETRLAADDVMEIGGVRVTTPLRTAYDCARTLPLVDAVVVADALAHAELLTVDELASYVAAHRRARGVKQADRVVLLVEPKAESPMETRLRLVIVLTGLPRPEAQITLYDEDGRFVGRVDLGWRDARIAIEYDGAHHWQQRRQDDRRRGAIADAGWAVRVYGADDVFNRQDYIHFQLRNLRAARLPTR